MSVDHSMNSRHGQGANHNDSDNDRPGHISRPNKIQKKVLKENIFQLFLVKNAKELSISLQRLVSKKLYFTQVYTEYFSLLAV